jgi:hypothetical protein
MCALERLDVLVSVVGKANRLRSACSVHVCVVIRAALGILAKHSHVQGLRRLSQRTPWQDGRFALDRAASRLWLLKNPYALVPLNFLAATDTLSSR